MVFEFEKKNFLQYFTAFGLFTVTMISFLPIFMSCHRRIENLSKSSLELARIFDILKLPKKAKTTVIVVVQSIKFIRFALMFSESVCSEWPFLSLRGQFSQKIDNYGHIYKLPVTKKLRSFVHLKGCGRRIIPINYRYLI
jgi:hypothetical protein